MERGWSGFGARREITGTDHRPSVRVRNGGLSLLSLSSQPRCVALVVGIVVLAFLPDERPASIDDGLLGVHPGLLVTTAISPDGHWLASGGYDSPGVIWELTRRQIVRTLDGGPITMRSVAFSPDGSMLAASDLDGRVWIWNTSEWTRQLDFQAHPTCVRSLAFSPDGKLLATGAVDRSVRLWDTTTWHAAGILQGHKSPLTCVAFSPDGRNLASASTDGMVRLWDVRSLASEIVNDLDHSGYGRFVNSLAFSRDGRYLAFHQGAILYLWELSRKQYRATRGNDQDYVFSLSFSPDSETLVAGTMCGNIEFWDVTTGRQRSALHGHSSAIWALTTLPNGRTLVSGEHTGSLRCWELTRPSGNSLSAWTPDRSRRSSRVVQ